MKVSNLFTSLKDLPPIETEDNFIKLKNIAASLEIDLREKNFPEEEHRTKTLCLLRIHNLLSGYIRTISSSRELAVASKFELTIPTLVQFSTSADDFI